MRENDEPVVKEAAKNPKSQLDARCFQETTTLEDLRLHLSKNASIR